MPIPPETLNIIHAIREFITSGGKSSVPDPGIRLLIHQLFENSTDIVSDAESLDAVLALAAEFEAYRGKGSQSGTREFYQRLSGFVYHAPKDLFEPGNRGDCLPAEVQASPFPGEGIPWFEKLGAHFFQRVQGPPVRSQYAGRLRATAWYALGDLSVFAKHPERLAHALRVAADPRGAEVEREAAVMFLPEYWQGETPDKATAELLDKLEKNPPCRSFLVSVLQTQIELGLNDEFGALGTVGDWDDAEVEE